jgi:heptosyltransferase III
VENRYKHILVVRTDSIGDVMLTLPLCGELKKNFPNCRITFLGKSYTQDVIAACVHVDQFVNADTLSQLSEEKQLEELQMLKCDAVVHVFPTRQWTKLCAKARIPIRVATSGRWFTWLTCNRRVRFSRKRSNLHESQLNMVLLRGLGLFVTPSLKEIELLYGFLPATDVDFPIDLKAEKTKVILHPLSKGSALNWPLDSFRALMEALPAEHFQIIISGTEAEGNVIRAALNPLPKHVIDATGTMNLRTFISFIGQCDALVAASTGPLHIAAALGVHAIGLYAPQRPIHPGRWQPVGKNTKVFVMSKAPQEGEMLAIDPLEVAAYLRELHAARLPK